MLDEEVDSGPGLPLLERQPTVLSGQVRSPLCRLPPDIRHDCHVPHRHHTAGRQTWNELPQQQVSAEFGLLKTNPRFSRSS